MKNTTKSKTISHLKSTTALALLATLGICVMNTSFSNMAQAETTHAEENNKDCKTNESKDKKCEEKNSFQLFIQSLMHRFFGSEDQNSAVHSEDKAGSGKGGQAVDNNSQNTGDAPPGTTDSSQSPQGNETPTGANNTTEDTKETGASMLSGATGSGSSSGSSTGGGGDSSSTTPAAPSESTQSPQGETPSGGTGTTNGTTGGSSGSSTESGTSTGQDGTGASMMQEPAPPTTSPPTTETPTGSDSSTTGGTIIKDKPTKTPLPTADVIIETPQATEPVTTPAPTTLPPKDQTLVTPPLSQQAPPPPKESLTSGAVGNSTPTEGTQPQGTQTLPQAVIVQPQVLTAAPFATFTPTTPAAPSSSAPLDLNSGVVINQNNQPVFLPSDPYKDVTLGGGNKTEIETTSSINTHGLGFLSQASRDTNPNTTLPPAIMLQPQVLTALPYSTFTPTPSPDSIEAERLILEGGQTTLILDRNDDTSTPPAANTTTYVNNTPAVGNPQAPSGTTMPLLDLNNANPVVTNGQLTINDTTTSTQPSSLADWAATLGQFNGTVAGGTTTTTQTIMLPGGAIITPTV